VEDDGEHDGEAHDMLNLAEERRSSFEKSNPRSYPNSAEDTYDGGGKWPMKTVLMVRKTDKGPSNRQIRLEKTLASRIGERRKRELRRKGSLPSSQAFGSRGFSEKRIFG
jgi:hypothetical protein